MINSFKRLWVHKNTSNTKGTCNNTCPFWSDRIAIT
nr:MAG TPA: hypothetical protein [Caudoviricetes sp.]